MELNICSPRSGDRDLQEFVWAVLGTEVFMLIFLNSNQIYDLSTAMFTAFGLGFLARGKHLSFYALFPVSCLNRETMVLLTIVFAVYYFWRLGWVHYLFGLAYQLATFAGIRIGTTTLYRDNPGQTFYFWPERVLAEYWSQPVLSLVLIGVCILVGMLILRSWQKTPALLRVALLVMLPVQIVLHVALGVAFEFRVFAEIFPVVWFLARK